VLNAKSWVQGAVAQLGERLVCNQEATGSIPVSSTIVNARVVYGTRDIADRLYRFRPVGLV
jgi:hypothetical protein